MVGVKRARKAMARTILSRRKLMRFLPRKRPGYIVVPIAILVVFVLVGVFAPLLAPKSPTEPVLSLRYQPPFWDKEGSWEYPLGTDGLGRDILSRLLFGVRVSLIFSVASVAVGASIGIILGLVSGYFGSWVDVVIMRIVDLAMALPLILMAMALAILMGPGFWSLLVCICLIIWARYARQARAETLYLKEQDFVALAKTSGASSMRIIFRHIFPNLVHTMVVLATLQIGFIILTEAALSFLGVGIPPPTPTLGSMVADGRIVISSHWWVSLFPGVAIGAVVLALNLFGDWLRDALDPKLRQV